MHKILPRDLRTAAGAKCVSPTVACLVTLILFSIISPPFTDHTGFTHRRTHARVGWQGPPHEQPVDCSPSRSIHSAPEVGGPPSTRTYAARRTRTGLGARLVEAEIIGRPQPNHAYLSIRAYPQTATTANPGAVGPDHQRIILRYPEWTPSSWQATYPSGRLADSLALTRTSRRGGPWASYVC